MRTITLNIQDKVYEHIMFLLKSLSPHDIEIIEKSSNPDLLQVDSNYEPWSEEDIKNIGKTGLCSKSFVEDNKDYSKW